MNTEWDVHNETERITEWIRDWFMQNGPKAHAVIGISGGKDSSIVSALLVSALGRERVVGVMMPDGVQKDIEDARELASFLNIRAFTIDVHPGISGVIESIRKSCGEDFSISKDTMINVAPRIRMTTLYAVAQSLPGGGRVANTCNASEDYIGYSTKYGDAAGDFS
ncbi:MAG: NAD(+) synthase, partial [Lachnospiraceae bacterium]|nr:NAD(+) synthase [Lachnospiraceae bacterium]